MIQEKIACPYCGEPNKAPDPEIHRDEDEHEIECVECQKDFWAVTELVVNFRAEKVEGQ